MPPGPTPPPGQEAAGRAQGVKEVAGCSWLCCLKLKQPALLVYMWGWDVPGEALHAGGAPLSTSASSQVGFVHKPDFKCP